MIKSSAIQHLYEIGDTGFLLGHWNGAVMARRQVVPRVMERLEEMDAGRMRELGDPAIERAISEAAAAIRRAETLPLEDL
jgi:hypothetical protein